MMMVDEFECGYTYSSTIQNKHDTVKRIPKINMDI